MDFAILPNSNGYSILFYSCLSEERGLFTDNKFFGFNSTVI